MRETVLKALADWEYGLPVPTVETRCLGFILEASIAAHLIESLPNNRIELGGPTAYPDICITDEQGRKHAFEVKASPKTTTIGNRLKSPGSVLAFYPRYESHWIIAVFYEFDDTKQFLRNVQLHVVPMWQYASATFKDMSALPALGSLDRILRRTATALAFRDETEFLDFMRHMSQHPGTTGQRSAEARAWLRQRRSG